MYSYAPSTTYSYPAYGGYYGNSYYGNGYYGGYGYPSYSQRWDNAGNHGINPSTRIRVIDSRSSRKRD